MIKETLADKILRLRSNKNWSQENLAEEAGLSYHTIFRAEAGEELSVASIKKIAKALRVPISELIDDNDSKQEQSRSDLILSIQSRLATLDYDELRTISSAVDDLAAVSASSFKTASTK